MSKGGGHQSTHQPSRVCAMKRFWWVVVIKELARNAKGYCPPYYTLRQFGSKKCNWVVCRDHLLVKSISRIVKLES